MTKQEQKTSYALASIYTFRMLGLFIILPIFSLYTEHLQAATPTLIGLALGIYGLTQAALQIPFAMASDKLGRKPVILFGLILFIIGSILAALSHNIYGIILGRALQGAGAIGSTLIALLADNIAEENRLKAMAVVGTSIGFSFIIAMVLGPLLNNWVGLSGIFWLTALLASISILILMYIVPTPKRFHLHRDSEPVWGQFKAVLRNTQLLRLNFGIFSSHAILMALFVVLPSILLEQTGVKANQQWLIYAPVLLVAAIAMVPFIIIAEKKRLLKPLFVAAILVLTVSQLFFYFSYHHIMVLSIFLCLFFTAFTFLEACLPSLIAKIAPAGNKGTAMGIYSSSQFLGIFLGGSLGGILLSHFGLSSIFIMCGSLGLIWFMLAYTMQSPQYLSSKILSLTNLSEVQKNNLQIKLLNLPGIKDVMICPDEQIAYLKIDKQTFSQPALDELLKS